MKYETPEETQVREIGGQAQFAGCTHLESGTRILERETQARIAQGETSADAEKNARTALSTKEARETAIQAFRAAEPKEFLPASVIDKLLKHKNGATEVFKHVVRTQDNNRHFARMGNKGGSGLVGALFGKKGA